MLLVLGAFVVGTVLYLYKYHKHKESYALNIVLTAFVSRVTGIEFIEAIKIRLFKIAYFIGNILYKKQFTNLKANSQAR